MVPLVPVLPDCRPNLEVPVFHQVRHDPSLRGPRPVPSIRGFQGVLQVQLDPCLRVFLPPQSFLVLRAYPCVLSFQAFQAYLDSLHFRALLFVPGVPVLLVNLLLRRFRFDRVVLGTPVDLGVR